MIGVCEDFQDRVCGTDDLSFHLKLELPAAKPTNAQRSRPSRIDSMGAGREAGPPSLLSPVSLASGSVRAREGGPVMSVYVEIDVHRKRSQVAVIDASGKVLSNRNVPNGVEPILGVIGGLPPEPRPRSRRRTARRGWSSWWRTTVHSLRCTAIASARLTNDKGPAPRSWPGCCGRTCGRRRGSPRPLSARCGRCCATGWRWCGCGRCCGPGSTPSWPGTVMTGRPAGPGPARCSSGLTGWAGRSASGPGPARGSRCSPGCRASARSPRWSSSPRPATSAGSGRRASWRRGPG
jgi:hypothetical protein